MYIKKMFYIGLDVHKRQTTYAIKDWNGNLVAQGQCATVFEELYKILEPYLFRCKVVMEACTSYYKLYQGFKSKKISVVVANVIHIRKLIGKNDKLDAIRLADMLRLNAVPASYIPCEEIQHLRTLVTLRQRFVKESTRLKNQIHAFLDLRGINIPTKTPFCKKWCERLQSYIAESDCFELRQLFDAQQEVSRRAKTISTEIVGYTKRKYGKELELVISIPGLGELFASYVLAQVLPISRFKNKKKLRRYAGVIPVSNMSDQHIYATFIPKATSRAILRYALVEAAHSALKTKTRLREYFKKKKKTKHTSQALMCVASSLSDIVYTVLSTGKPYQA